MSEALIRTIDAGDIDSALELCQAAGWNQLATDWQRVIQYQREGCFVATVDQHVVGTVTTTSYGNQLAWIGMMLVAPEYQRRGIATSLMRRSLDYLDSHAVQCIKLDATPVGQKVYEKLGFQPEWSFNRWVRGSVRSGSKRRSWSGGQNDHQFELPRPLLQAEHEAFGVDRLEFLKAVAGDSQCYVQHDAYGMIRNGGRACYLGPIVATSYTSAEQVILQLLEDSEDDIVFWDVPQGNRAAVSMAEHLGFSPVRDLTRMWTGSRCIAPRIEYQYGMIDPAVG